MEKSKIQRKSQHYHKEAVSDYQSSVQNQFLQMRITLMEPEKGTLDLNPYNLPSGRGREHPEMHQYFQWYHCRSRVDKQAVAVPKFETSHASHIRLTFEKSPETAKNNLDGQPKDKKLWSWNSDMKDVISLQLPTVCWDEQTSYCRA